MTITTEERHGGHFRVMTADGERVSHLGIYDHVMRIGPAEFKMGGIGGVATQWQHRNRGYSRTVMEDSIRWMKDEGYDVTILFGIERFYHKFGYANCEEEPVWRVKTRDAEPMTAEARGYKARALKDADWPAVLELYNRKNAGRSLSIVRHPKTFRGIRHGSGFKIDGEGVVFLTPSGRLAGYAIIDSAPHQTMACEVEAVEPKVYLSILSHLVRIAIRRRDGEIAAQLPLDHPFGGFLRRFGSVLTVTARNTGGIMGRLVNQDAVLAKLAAAYERERGLTRGRAGGVTVATELGATAVRTPGLPVRSKARLVIPAMTLFQALVGFRAAGEILTSPGVKATGGGEKVLEFLQSGAAAYMYSVDHF